MRIEAVMRVRMVLAFAVFMAGAAIAQTATESRNIHMIYMGGNDCPPCVEWRRTELAKLQKTEAFKAILFSYVAKTIKSPVPSSFFLPDDVKPYKEKLDAAGAGFGGSAQVAILVNGEVFDYYFGTRSAKEVEEMILAIKTGAEYPFRRCIKMAGWGKCAVHGE